jgi:MinD-like ATPase involved in chromosome partitioning or flagellar assembly
MATLIAVHSFRRGTGKSTLAANLAALLADGGLRVGLIDANMQSPSLQLLFGMADLGRRPTINDYLAGRCELAMAAIEVGRRLSPPAPGALYLVPASGEADRILEALRGSYRAEALSEGFAALADSLGLDLLLVDTHAGLSEETLLTIASADTLLLLLRPDHQDYHGTGMTIELARRLGAPQLLLVVNEIPRGFDADAVAAQVSRGFGQPVIATMPHSQELQVLGSAGLLVRSRPDSPPAQAIARIAAHFLPPGLRA